MARSGLAWGSAIFDLSRQCGAGQVGGGKGTFPLSVQAEAIQPGKMTNPTADHPGMFQQGKIDRDFGAGAVDQPPADEGGPVLEVEPVDGIRDVLNADVEVTAIDSGPVVRDHRGEDPSLPPGQHDDSDGDPIVRDHRDGPLDDFFFDFGF